MLNVRNELPAYIIIWQKWPFSIESCVLFVTLAEWIACKEHANTTSWPVRMRMCVCVHLKRITKKSTVKMCMGSRAWVNANKTSVRLLMKTFYKMVQYAFQSAKSEKTIMWDWKMGWRGWWLAKCWKNHLTLPVISLKSKQQR